VARVLGPLVGPLVLGAVAGLLAFLQAWPLWLVFLLFWAGSWCSLQHDDTYINARERRTR
jgi:hypothetical protein